VASALGAVPRALVWDGEGVIGRWRSGRVELTSECQAFRGTLAAKVIVCRPADPEAKGLIERTQVIGSRTIRSIAKSAAPGGIAHVSNKSSLPVKRAGLGGKREIKRVHITTEIQVAVTFRCDSEQRV
jgi:transposase